MGRHIRAGGSGLFVPGIHFVLLDSDCVPVTLFEVADLWKEISLLRTGLAHATVSSRKGSGSRETSESVPKVSKLSHDRWQHQITGQGVLLVTEHNAEVNAGFIVAFASSHRSAVAEDRWRQISGVKGSAQEVEVLQHEADRLASLYWDYVHDFLDSRRLLEEIDSVECAAWVKLALPSHHLRAVLLSIHVTGLLPGVSQGSGLLRKSFCPLLVSGHGMDTPRIC